MLIKLPLEVFNYGKFESIFKQCLFETTAIVSIQDVNYEVQDVPQLFQKVTVDKKETYKLFSDPTVKTLIRTRITAIDGISYITNLSVEEVEALIKGAA